MEITSTDYARISLHVKSLYVLYMIIDGWEPVCFYIYLKQYIFDNIENILA